MENLGPYVSSDGLDEHGIRNVNHVYWNLPVARLYEQAVARGEGLIAADGPLLATTGRHTGRSPLDRFIVKDAETEKDIWWGSVNRSIGANEFEGLRSRVRAYLQNRDLFVFDGYAGADSRYRLPVRIVTEFAWHSLFARNMFVRELDGDKLRSFSPGFTVLAFPGFHAEPEEDGTHSSAFIVLDISRKLVLIGGTHYAGEIKKSIFTVMNYFLPRSNVLSMHCSANYGADQDDVALFFGLSGTGKTTLSADPARTLIGDDEHGWSADGVFNIEGGCYAKMIRLDPKGEPDIYRTTRRFGTILENVVVDTETRELDLDDATLTENTRGSYPLSQIPNADRDGVAGHAKNVIFLTCDAFGVLPPVSRLREPQALYHFLSGYTAKVAGTERGVTEPSATFSTCFGAPFMPLHPSVYARMLGERLRRHSATAWLVNTGWSGGGYGVGKRMKLAYTRSMVTGILSGALHGVATEADPVFGLEIPQEVAGVPGELLTPRRTWADPAAYDLQAAKLARMFRDNFEQFEDGVTAEVIAAGPVAGRD